MLEGVQEGFTRTGNLCIQTVNKGEGQTTVQMHTSMRHEGFANQGNSAQLEQRSHMGWGNEMEKE
jgi:hypothetical protein